MRQAPPRRATKPTEGATNELASIVKIASLMRRPAPGGKRAPAPLLAHQRLVAQVASEKTPDGKRFRYPIVVLTMPRRSGKTVLIEAIMTQRALKDPGQAIYYTAQRASDAQAAWGELVETLRNSPGLNPYIDKVYRSKGASLLKFSGSEDKPIGSTIAPFTPNASALDGKNASLVVIDEAFSLDEVKGEELMQSVSPTLTNVDNAQLWIISTAGYSDSTWLKGWIDSAAACLNDPNAPYALFDWGMCEGGDPDSPEEWAKFHPGLTSGLTTVEGLQAAHARARTREEWLRGYCNTWSINAAAPLLDLENWQTLSAEAPLPGDRAKIRYGLGVAAGAARASIAAAWRHNGKPYVTIVKDAPGTDWIAPTLEALGNPKITAWDAGPCRVILDQLPARMQNRIKRVNSHEQGAAVQTLITLADNKDLAHANSAALNQALSDAAPKQFGEGTGLDAKKSRGPVSAVRAAALAVHEIHKPTAVLQVF